MLPSLVHHQILYGLDPAPSLLLLRSFVQGTLVDNWDPHVIMLARALDSAPLGGAQDSILDLCLDLLNLGKLSKLVAGTQLFSS